MITQKTVTIFGGTGFVGRHIVTALARAGLRIRIATRHPAKVYFLKPLGDIGQITAFSCNIHDDASVARALHGADYAINLIGVLNDGSGKNSFTRIHSDTAERIARIARQEGLGLLVHVSALGATAASGSRYGRSKAEGENRAIHAFGQTVILRPSLIFGTDDNFFNRFARMAQVSPMLPLIAGGRTKFQPVFAGDIAAAVRNILCDPNQGKYFGQIYELVGPAVYSFRELLQMMLHETRLSSTLVWLPAPVAKIMAFFTRFLPDPPLTVDQIRSLTEDNIQSPHSAGLRELGVAPTMLEAILPTYLAQYRPGGRFSGK
jgi:NADH dehydrogenase